MQMKTQSSEKETEVDHSISENNVNNKSVENEKDIKGTTQQKSIKEKGTSNQKQRSVQKQQLQQQQKQSQQQSQQSQSQSIQNNVPKYAFNQNNFYENAIFSYVNNINNEHLYAVDPNQFYLSTASQPYISTNQPITRVLKRHPKGQSQVSLADDNQNHFLHDNHFEYTKKERPSTTSKTNIYIRGLDEDTTDKDLHEMCQKFGEIKSTKAIIEKQTNKCKGYGFVDYKSPEDALKALSEMKKEQKDVQLAKQREQDPTNLYFANLPNNIDEKCLTELLQKKFNATVNSTRIMRERTGNSKGVGFARVEFKDTCEKIIRELNGHSFPEHEDKSRILLVKLADSGTNFKYTKSFKGIQSNKLPNENDLSNRFLNPNGMSHIIDPSLNNGYPITMYENPQLIHNASYMHLFPHQLQPASIASQNQQYITTSNQSIARPTQITQNPHPNSQQHQQSNNMNANVQNSIYYANTAIIPSTPHHSMLPTAIHLPYVFLPQANQNISISNQQPSVGHYQMPTQPNQTSTVAYENKNSTMNTNESYNVNLQVNNRAPSVPSNSTMNSNNQYNEAVSQSNLQQFTSQNSGHVTASAVQSQNQQYQYQQ